MQELAALTDGQCHRGDPALPTDLFLVGEPRQSVKWAYQREHVREPPRWLSW